jgi:hypothetical protein
LPEGDTLVSDRRFADLGHAVVNYSARGRWLSEDDPRLSTIVAGAPNVSLEEEAVSDLVIPPKKSNPAMYAVWVAAALVTSVFAMKWLFNRTSAKGKQA